MSRRRPPADADAGPRNDWDSAFADIVSNLFGVMLILTVIALVTTAAGEIMTNQAGEGKERLRFAPAPFERFPPWSDYWVIKGDRVVRLDLEAVAAEVGADRLTPRGNDLVGATPQATFTWEDERVFFELGLAADVGTSDLDAFKLRLRLDEAWLASQPPMTAPAPGQVVQALFAADTTGRRVPGIFVYASGFELFARLQPLLIARGLRFRWTPLEEDEPVLIYQDKTKFTADEFRR